jgi:hypothetical protein
MKLKVFFVFLLLCITTLSFSQSFPVKNVLTADTNKDGIVSVETVKNGKDLILVKQNPSKISPSDAVFQTTKYNLYVAATFDDLLVPDAFKTLLFGKVMPDGMIKTYTLSNLGYTDLEVETNSNNQKEIFLVDRKNHKTKVVTMPYQAAIHKTYEEEKDKDKSKNKGKTKKIPRA